MKIRILLFIAAIGIVACGKAGSSIAKAAVRGAAGAATGKLIDKVLEKEPRGNPSPRSYRNRLGGRAYWNGSQPLGYSARDPSGRMRYYHPNGALIR